MGHTGSREKELAKNTAIIGIGKICTQFIGFFLLPLYTAKLNTQEYGIVELFQTLIMLLTPVVTLQTGQAVFRFLVDEREDEAGKSRVISTQFGFLAVETALFVVAFLGIKLFADIPYAGLFAVNLLASSFSVVLLQTARGLGNNAVYSAGAFLSATVTIIFNIVFIVGFQMQATGMLIATLLGSASCTLFVFFRQRLNRYIQKAAACGDTLKKMLRYSVPMIPSAVSWWVVSASDRLIVTAFLGLSSTGILSVANKFPSVFSSVYGVVNLSWTESVALYLNKEDGERYFSDTLNVLLKAFVSIAIGIIAVMPFVFPVMVNRRYAASYPQIPIYMLGALMDTATGLLNAVYFAKKQTTKLAKSTVTAAIINVTVHFLLLRRIGLFAASISTAIAYGTIMLLRYTEVKRMVSYTLDRFFVLSAILLTAVLFVVYYSGSFMTQLIGLSAAVVFAVYFNRGLLQKMMDYGKRIPVFRRSERK